MIRKILNFKNKEQELLVLADVQNILDKCDVIASKEYAEQKEARESHDSVCPACRTRKEKNNIVNKIRQVHGKGSVGGNLFGVSGYMEVDTDEVNHCNACGNEWKKFKIKYVSKSDIVRVALNYLGSILKDPEEKKYTWKIEAIKVFDDCYAETIVRLRDENSSYIYSSTESQLKLNILRYYYKSVFDEGKKNKKELEIL
jgi:hypothetical protein